jgi:hypothetical protein
MLIASSRCNIWTEGCDCTVSAAVVAAVDVDVAVAVVVAAAVAVAAVVVVVGVVVRETDAAEFISFLRFRDKYCNCD